jgi:hypothetical protein
MLYKQQPSQSVLNVLAVFEQHPAQQLSIKEVCVKLGYRLNVDALIYHLYKQGKLQRTATKPYRYSLK